MKTKYIIIALALFIVPAVTAQDYFAKLRYYFGDNSPIVQQQNTLKIHNTFTNPETGEKEVNLQSISSHCLKPTSVTPIA